MFTEIINLIEERKLADAVAALTPIYKSDDPKSAAYAGYLLGYINTRYDYDKKSKPQAKRFLRENIHSDYPHPNAYALYARVEDDPNIALNHLNNGLLRFPKDPRILKELMAKSPDKDAVVALIKDSGLGNPELLGNVIEYLIKEKQWSRIARFLFRIENEGHLEEDEQLYLNLIRAYTYAFQDENHYPNACEVFEQVIAKDVDNTLAYSHYLGYIYSLIKWGDITKATQYFDRLPVNNSIMDFDDGPWPFGIYINFEEIYKAIFSCIIDTFKHDDARKLKARTLYALYLYFPAESSEIHRYTKSDASVLTRYLKAEFNPKVAAVLYNMRCHHNQFKEAYDVLWRFLQEQESLTDYWIFFSDIIDSADEERLAMLVEETLLHLQEDDYTEEAFVDEVFVELIQKLHKAEMFSSACKIIEFISDEQIIRSDCTFYCAYALGCESSSRATLLYEKLVEKEPHNASAFNNLGVQYRDQDKLYEALQCYEKACQIEPPNELYAKNLKIIRENIQEEIQESVDIASDNLSIVSLQQIGYTVDLCKKVHSIKDNDLKEIILRDLYECAIAVVSGLDKLAAIMCGSIVEALLLYQLTERGIKKYDIKQIKQKHPESSNYPVSQMALNELLYVALEEKLIGTSNHHLGHYIKDYRNMVHPAKEIRMKECITHETVTTMWAVLIKLISDIFPY